MTGPRIGLGSLRESVRQAVAVSSLRTVADDIGMSFSGLRSFLGGRRPQRGTLEKLSRWFMRERGGREQRETLADVEAAAALLRAYIAEAKRPESREKRRRQVSAWLE